MTELYGILADNKSYEKYINDLFAVANEYTKRGIALSALHTEAFMQSVKKPEEFDPADIMCQMYECMSEADQKRFCQEMFQKKGFFEDAYETMMNVFENVVEKNERNNINDNNTVKE